MVLLDRGDRGDTLVFRFFRCVRFFSKITEKPHTTLALKSEAVTPVTPVPFGAVQYPPVPLRGSAPDQDPHRPQHRGRITSMQRNNAGFDLGYRRYRRYRT